MIKAVLMLEDGTSFEGRSIGAEGEAFGELCFNTAMIGYPEVLSDPSAAGQIITMTYPQIGNYGITRADLERPEAALRGLVARDICTTPSSFRCDLSLPDYLLEQGIVAISGVDTRAVTRHIRDHGAMRAGISTLGQDAGSLLAKVKSSPGLEAQNLAETVSVAAPLPFTYDPVPFRFIFGEPPAATHKVVAYDCGAKQSMLRDLVRAGCSVELVPWDSAADEVLAKEPDGVFISSGPGSPEHMEATIAAARGLLGKVPLFGVCLGYLVIGKAIGAEVEKLKHGHRGGNQPVMNLLTNQVEITAQNHSFSLRFETMGPLIAELSGGEGTHPEDLREWVRRRIAPVVKTADFGRVKLTHVNLNDGTPEGFAFLDLAAFCVQYYPVASAMVSDSYKALASTEASDIYNTFSAFVSMMDGKGYLGIENPSGAQGGWE